MLHVCLAVSGKELTSLDAEEIEGKSAKALKQLGLKKLEAKRWVILSRSKVPRWFERLCLYFETLCNVGK